MKALVIGVGRMGSTFDELKEKDWTNTHLGAYLKNRRIREVAICDRDASALKRAQKFWHISHIYGDVQQALQEFKPSIISLCIKPDQNIGILKEVSRFKCVRYIWFEKPFSDSFRNGLRQLKLLKEKGIYFITNYQRRFDPFYIYIKTHLDDLIGKPSKCVCFFSGGILNTTSHIVNLLIFYFGIPLSCRPLNIRPDTKGDFHGDFYIDFKRSKAYCFELGQQSSSLSGGYSIFEILIFGDKGRIDLNSLPLNEYDFCYWAKGPSRFKGTDILIKKDLRLNFKRDYMERELEILLEKGSKKTKLDVEESTETLKVFKELGLID